MGNSHNSNQQQQHSSSVATAAAYCRLKANDLMISTPFRRPHLGGARRAEKWSHCPDCLGSSNNQDDHCDSDYGHSSLVHNYDNDYDLNQSVSMANSAFRSRLLSQQHLHLDHYKQFTACGTTTTTYRRHKPHHHHRPYYSHQRHRERHDRHNHHHHHNHHHNHHDHHQRAYTQASGGHYRSRFNYNQRLYKNSNSRINHDQQQQEQQLQHSYYKDDFLSIEFGATSYDNQEAVKQSRASTLSKRRRQSNLTETSSTPSTSSGGGGGGVGGSQRGTRPAVEMIQSSSSSSGSSGAGATSTTLTIASYLLNHQRQVQQMNNNNNMSNLSDTEDSLASATLNSSYSSQSHKVFKQTPAAAAAPASTLANRYNNNSNREDESKWYSARTKLQIMQRQRRFDSPGNESASTESPPPPPPIELQSFSSNCNGQPSAPMAAGAAMNSTTTTTGSSGCDDGNYCLNEQPVVPSACNQTIVADQNMSMVEDNTSDICSVVAEPPRQLKLEEFLNQLNSVIAPNKNAHMQQQQQQQQQLHEQAAQYVNGSQRLHANNKSRLIASDAGAGFGNEAAAMRICETLKQQRQQRQDCDNDEDEDDEDCKSHSSILDHLSSLTLESNLKLRHQFNRVNEPNSTNDKQREQQLFGICSLNSDCVIQKSDDNGNSSSCGPFINSGRVNIVDQEQNETAGGRSNQSEPISGHLQQLLKSTLQLQNNVSPQTPTLQLQSQSQQQQQQQQPKPQANDLLAYKIPAYLVRGEPCSAELRLL